MTATHLYAIPAILNVRARSPWEAQRIAEHLDGVEIPHGQEFDAHVSLGATQQQDDDEGDTP